MAILPVATSYEQPGVKDAQIQYISQYVGDLRSIIGYYIGWIYEAHHDVEDFYKIMENDAALKHALHLLSLMVAGEYWEISGPNKKLNKIMARGLSYIERFTHARKTMLEKSVLYGLSVQKKYWKKVTWPEYPGMVWEVPYRLKEVDRRRMRIERDLNDKTNLWWTIWDPKFDRYIILEDRADEPEAVAAVQDYVWKLHEEEESEPYGKGMGTVLYQLAYIKHKIIQYWADLAEHWGRPLMIATINSARVAINAAVNGGAGMQDSSTAVNNWLDLMENMRARHVAVKPDHDSLDIHEAGTTGNNIIKELVDYIDNKFQLIILGAELTTIAPSVGSYALGQIHKGATNSIVMYNRNGIEEIIERDLLRDFFLRNKQNFYRLGLKWPGPNGVKFEIKVKQEEQKEEMMEQMKKEGGQEGGGDDPPQKMMKELGL